MLNLSQAQLALGSSGFLQLCAIVQCEQADFELVQGALEALALSMTRRPKTTNSKASLCWAFILERLGSLMMK